LVDLVLDIPPGEGRRAGLEDALRRAVRSGRLPAGTRLPSSRALATDLGCARATVVAAYEQLVVEGYLEARRGSGTVVAPVRVETSAGPSPRRARAAGPAVDLRPGEPDRSSFPRAQWARSLRRVLEHAPDDLLAYGDPLGLPVLRQALVTYLARSRAVAATPEQVVVGRGFTSELGLLARTLVRGGVGTLAVEEAGLPFHHRVARDHGLRIAPVPVDAEGLVVDHLDAVGAGAVLVTPAHQYPLGMTLSPSRRSALLRWARAREAWIVEDDYDGEFRFDRQPVGALQGLDPERVVYAGTTSKSLAAGLRLSWLVLPRPLVDPLLEAHGWPGSVSALEQAALADLIGTGRLDRHVRRVRARYRERRDALVAALAVAAPWLSPTGVAAGLHVSALFDGGPDAERRLVQEAAARSIGLMGLGPHWVGPPRATGLVIGYSRPPAHGYRSALDRLTTFLAEAAPPGVHRGRRGASCDALMIS
jgi:GntR family transcriptional regulator / MocR family aminotransferase